MYIIGITGGMGVGKTTVSSFFLKKKIPIYNSDLSAKIIMEKDINLKKKIINYFGNYSYKDNKLNNKYLSKIVFNNFCMLKKLNKIVHPLVINDFNKWVFNHRLKNKFKYCINESAILFINHELYKLCKYIIIVNSLLKIRIKRIIKRDSINKHEVIKRIRIQSMLNNIINYRDKKNNYLLINNNKSLMNLNFKLENLNFSILKN